MGSRNPDRVPLAYRRARCETVQQMLDQRWPLTMWTAAAAAAAARR